MCSSDLTAEINQQRVSDFWQSEITKRGERDDEVLVSHLNADRLGSDASFSVSRWQDSDFDRVVTATVSRGDRRSVEGSEQTGGD